MSIEVFGPGTAANESVRGKVPTILRPTKGRVRLWLPFKASGAHNRDWIKSGFGTGASLRPQLIQPNNVWTIGRNHLALAVDEVADQCGFVDVYLQFEEKQRCNDSCLNAVLDECVCSCLGVNHGGGLYPGRRIRSMRIANGVTEVVTRVSRGASWSPARRVVAQW